MNIEPNKEILAIIPARGGSKGILNKNIIELASIPLIGWTINAAKRSKYISRTIVSTDSIDIKKISHSFNVEVPFMRPEILSRDDSKSIDVIIHALNWLSENESYKPDLILLLQPTSPLRRFFHIDEAIEKLLYRPDADSVVSVIDVPHHFIPDALMVENGDYIKHMYTNNENFSIRQKKPRYIARNGAAIYAFTYDCINSKKSIYGDKIIPYYMQKLYSYDIDDELDLEICHHIIKKYPELFF